MCSITINEPADHVDLDKKNKDLIERRMVALAKNSSITCKGALDIAPMTGISKMSPGLSSLKKWRVGRHRIYYLGHHSQCCYQIIYIKPFKRDGVDDDNSKAFHKILMSVMSNDSSRTLN